MIIIVLILICSFVGIAFKRLAESYKKTVAPVVILGILVFVIGYFLGGFVLGLVGSFLDVNVSEFNPITLLLSMVIIGALCCILVYFSFQNYWKNKAVEFDVLDHLE